MEEGETTKKMFNQLNNIVVGLKDPKKIIRKVELNWKLHLSLPKEWRPKVRIIEEAKDFTSMTMEELVESLIIHEHTLQMNKEVENNKQKKDLVLKILMQSDEGDLDEEMTLITKNFKKFLCNKVGVSTSRK